jgi:divalent metal cation (Fe/Co/Zn/Cd) transporter
MAGTPISLTRRAALRRGRRLESFTIFWNSLEATIAIVAGLVAGSISLVGFGVDSVIEVTSAVILYWRLWGDHYDDATERREKVAIRLVGVCFLALAVYVAYEAIAALLQHHVPARSNLGIGLAVASLIAMPLLARAKRGVARELNSGALHADSRQTDFCFYLSFILLAGLGLNAAFGWWWADPAAALAMAPIIAREGIEGVRGKSCACD